MKQLKLVIVLMLFSIAGCLQSGEKNDISASSNDDLNPYIVHLYVNGVLLPNGESSANLKVGDSLSIKVNADNTYEPLEYAFYMARSGHSRITLQDYSSSDLLSDYIVTEDDASYATNIWIAIKNNDGSEVYGPSLGDRQHHVTLYVSGEKQRPVVDSVNLYVNGILKDLDYSEFKVGDVVSIEVNASDPKSLPIEYDFKLTSGCRSDRVLQAYSSSNTLSNFVLTADELDSCSSISISIKNNDGADFFEIVGDYMTRIQLESHP